MTPTRKIRLLALHGKGTSARIMKAQIKPIIDMVDDVVEVQYMDGGERSAPYQGIESIFPTEPYYAWYHQPTRGALQTAHARVAKRLSSKIVETIDPKGERMVDMSKSSKDHNSGFLTPPKTRRSSTSTSSPFQIFVSPVNPAHEGHTVVGQGSGGFVAGIDTPISCPGTAGTRTPLIEEPGTYDGLICFSQGCAVSTGLLLEMQTKLGSLEGLAVRVVILICGGRPFEADGTMERVDETCVAPISVRSVHVHGRRDPGLDESRKLAALYSDGPKEVVELDIGHCPPRRSSDVEMVAGAIRRAIW